MRGPAVYVIVILVLTVLTLAQTIPPVFGQITFEKTYGGTDRDWGYSVQQTPDGGYVIAGHTDVGLSMDVYLVKTDSLGDLLWDATCGDSALDEFAYCVDQTSDGGFVVAGHNSRFNFDICVAKVDSLGDSLWMRTFGTWWWDEGHSIKQTLDGGYITTGWNTFHTDDQDVYLVKTDSLGNRLWDKVYGGDWDDYGYSVQLTRDGGYIIAGYTHPSGAESTDVYLVKTDSLGQMMWQRAYGGSGSDYGASVQQTLDGGYIVVGHTNSYGADPTNIYLTRTDSLGEVIWWKTYGGAKSDSGWSVRQTSDGGFIIAGETDSYGHGSADVYILKTDALGNLLWARTYGGTWGDHAYCVRQTSDGGYIVAGWTRSFGAGYYDVYVIKTDSEGKVGLEEELRLPQRESSGQLLQVSPNPCYGSTKIHYSVPTPGHVNISIYDVAGRFVENLMEEWRKPGIYSLTWDAVNLPSGSYFSSLAIDGYSDVKKITVLDTK